MRLRKRFLIIGALFLIIPAKIFLNSAYNLPILMYHSIDYTSDNNDRLTVPPEIFERQMKYLRDEDYNIVPIEKAVPYIKEMKRPPAKTVAITFDDGKKNNYTHAYPALKKYNIPATVFIITDKIGDEKFLNWSEIEKMAGSGMIDVESHTRSHRLLPYLEDEAIRAELAGSRRILSERLGKDVKFLCYPSGRFDERVKTAARAAGYQAAFATKPTKLFSNNDPYEIRRIRVASDNLIVFAAKTSGYYSFLRVIKEYFTNIPNIIWKKRSSS